MCCFEVFYFLPEGEHYNVECGHLCHVSTRKQRSKPVEDEGEGKTGKH